MSRHEPRITKDSNDYYALIVRIDRDGEETVIRGYKGRYFRTKERAIKSTSNYIRDYLKGSDFVIDDEGNPCLKIEGRA